MPFRPKEIEVETNSSPLLRQMLPQWYQLVVLKLLVNSRNKQMSKYIVHNGIRFFTLGKKATNTKREEKTL